MIKNNFVKVKGLDTNEIVEFPLEVDNTLSYELLTSQFPYAAVLKCINKINSQIKTVRKSDGKFFLAKNVKWEDLLFFCSSGQTKKKSTENSKEVTVKPRHRESIESIHQKFPLTFDLLAMGLSFDTTEKGLCEYLSRFGELLYCHLKLDDVSNESRGTAFFRFKDVKAHNQCLSGTHVVDKTKIIIKIPKEKIMVGNDKAYKLFLYNISPSITREDIRAYFSQFGTVINLFKPYDQRNFAFITFSEESSLNRTLSAGYSHAFNGGRVSVNKVIQKENLATELKQTHKTPDSCNKSNHGVKRNGQEVKDVSQKGEKLMKIGNVVESYKQFKPHSRWEEKASTSQMALPAISYPNNFALISQPCHSNDIASMQSSSSHVPQPSPYYSNHLQPSMCYGSTTTSFPQNPCSSNSTIPNQILGPMMYPWNPPMVVPPSPWPILPQGSLYQQSDKATTPSKTQEEKRLLKSLLNEFIHEMQNTLTKLTN